MESQTNPPNKNARRQQGVALVIVLWTALLLSVILAIAINSARIEARITAAERETFLARQAAVDGLEYAAYAIAAEHAGSTDNLSDLKFSINGYDVTFSLAHESEKLDVNLAGERMISSFFRFLGEPQNEADTLAARLADWRDTDDLSRPNGAEARDYANAKNGEKIGNRPFYSADEISMVLDMPEALMRCALPALTIFGDNSAPSSTLLTTLYGDDMERTEAASNVQLGTASRSAAAGKRYAISATATDTENPAQRSFTLTGLFRITGGRDRPHQWIAQFDANDEVSVDENCKKVAL